MDFSGTLGQSFLTPDSASKRGSHQSNQASASDFRFSVLRLELRYHVVLPRNKSASLYDCEHSCDEDWYHIIVDIMSFTLIAIVMIAHNNEIT